MNYYKPAIGAVLNSSENIFYIQMMYIDDHIELVQIGRGYEKLETRHKHEGGGGKGGRRKGIEIEINKPL